MKFFVKKTSRLSTHEIVIWHTHTLDYPLLLRPLFFSPLFRSSFFSIHRKTQPEERGRRKKTKSESERNDVDDDDDDKDVLSEIQDEADQTRLDKM